jgi:hypothetical protein
MLPPASVNSLLRRKPPVSVSVAPDSAIGLLRLQPPESAFFASFASSISLLRLQYQSPSPPVSVSFASRLRYRPPSPPASHIGLLRLQTSVSASFASSLPYQSPLPPNSGIGLLRLRKRASCCSWSLRYLPPAYQPPDYVSFCVGASAPPSVHSDSKQQFLSSSIFKACTETHRKKST